MIENDICENLYKVDLENGIEWIYDIWYRPSNSIIRNCWVKIGIIAKFKIV